MRNEVWFLTTINEAESVLPHGQAARIRKTGLDRNKLSLYAMMAIPFLLTLVYSYGPLAGLAIAFQQYDLSKGLFGSPWVGLDNFRYLFRLPGFDRVVTNTLLISVAKLVLQIVVPLTVALMLNELRARRFKSFLQSAIYLPNFISWVIIAGMLRDILSPSTGILNHVLKLTGADPILFLADRTWFPVVIILSDAWQSFGFGTILYMAALTQIDPNLYEAAMMDGAKRHHQIRHITIPGMMNVIVLSFVLKLGFVVQNAGFNQIVNLYSPAVYSTGDILDTFLYRIAFESSYPQYDIAIAMSLLKSIVSFVLVSTSYWVAHKVADYQVF